MREKRIFIQCGKFVFALIIAISILGNKVYAGCSANYYIKLSSCNKCVIGDYSNDKTDNCTMHHKRQLSYLFCTDHKNMISSNAEYYKRGFTDYNCLAYALGNNKAGSWEWPVSWGSEGPTRDEFIEYIVKKGYNYSNQKNISYGKKIFCVYEKNGHIKHFA